jgi:hypothetical protein
VYGSFDGSTFEGLPEHLQVTYDQCERKVCRSFGERIELLRKLIELIPEMILIDYPQFKKKHKDYFLMENKGAKFKSNIPEASDISSACSDYADVRMELRFQADAEDLKKLCIRIERKFDSETKKKMELESI